MQLIRKILIWTFLILFCLKATYGQLQFQGVKNKVAAFEEFYQNAKAEKLYLHTDRDIFISGEEIWFAAHLQKNKGINGEGSKVAYIELLNANNKPVVQQKLPIRDNKAEGMFVIPDSLSSGTYIIRAYTQRLLSFGPAFYFWKPLTILNPFKESLYLSEEASQPSEGKVSVDFYPEGGHLVYGHKNRMGLKVTNQLGLGIPIKGVIQNETGDTIAKVQCNQIGFGLVEFTPETAHQYLLSFNVNDRRLEFPVDLPTETEIALSTKRTNDHFIKVEVRAGSKYLEEHGRDYYIVLQTKGTVNFQDNRQFNQSYDLVSIPESYLDEGINQLVLFDSQGNILAKRLLYTPDRTIRSDRSLNMEQYGEREMARINLPLKDLVGSAPAVLSVSVSVKEGNTTVPPNTIQLDLLSEFSDISEKLELYDILITQNATEVENWLVMANSYLYSWDIDHKTRIQMDHEQDGLFLSGSVIQQGSGAPVENELLYLSLPGTSTHFQYGISDQKGQFKFLMPNRAGVEDVVIQLANKDAKDLRISINNPFSLEYLETGAETIGPGLDLIEKAKEWSINYQLKQIYSESVLEQSPQEELIIPNFYGKVDKYLNLDNYITLPVLEEVFYELIYGVRLRKTRSGYEFVVLDPIFNTTMSTTPAIFLDGVMVFDVNQVAEMNPEIFKSIEVVRDRYQIGDIILDGIISLYTQEGNMGMIDLPSSAIRRYFPLFNEVPVFQSADYTDPTFNKRIPDLRNTLFWNSNVVSSNDGNVEIEFFTSDFHSEYLISLMGISESGELISVQKVISVK